MYCKNYFSQLADSASCCMLFWKFLHQPSACAGILNSYEMAYFVHLWSMLFFRSPKFHKINIASFCFNVLIPHGNYRFGIKYLPITVSKFLYYFKKNKTVRFLIALLWKNLKVFTLIPSGQLGLLHDSLSMY